MSDLTQAAPTGAVAVRTQTFGQRLLPICYFGIVTVAMAGWLWAIGWLVLAAANWLFA